MSENEAGGSVIPNLLKRPPVGLAAEIATGESYQSIASRLGVRRQTVAGWAALPEVVAELDRLEQETIKRARIRLNTLVDKALDTLFEVMEKGDSSSARVSASKLVIERIVPSMTQTEISGHVGVTDIRTMTTEALIAERDALREKVAGSVTIPLTSDEPVPPEEP